MSSATDTTDALVSCRLQVRGMDCGDCAKTVEQSLRSMPGVEDAAVRFASGMASVTYDPARTDATAFVRRVAALGYTAQPMATPAPLIAVAPVAPMCGCGDCAGDEHDHGHEHDEHGATAPASSASSAATRGTTWKFAVTGMDCGDCAKTVAAGVSRLPGVRDAHVNFAAGSLAVVADGGSIAPHAVIAAVKAAGYGATLRDGAASAAPLSDAPAWWRNRRVWELAAATALWLVGFALEKLDAPRLAVAVPYLAGMLLGGYPVARAAWFALRARRADMNLLMTVAAVGAVAIGQWEEGASVLILFGIGTQLQAMTVERTRGAIARLLALAPAEAMVLHGDHEHRVPIAHVSVGESVRVRPGERVPLDGIILAGRSAVDQAPITGESLPVAVEPGSTVFAGSINGDGTLDLRTTKPASDTALARMIALVEEAQASKAPAQAFVDRFAAVYTPLVIAAAAFVALVPPLIVGDWQAWIFRALVLLVIACPCALVISTPVALVAAIGAASRRGVLFKGGAALEALAAVRTIAFDKTGTLTEGKPAVVAIHACEGATEADVLATAAALESRSEHPLARAIVAAARARNAVLPPVAEYAAVPGRGGAGFVSGEAASVGSPRWFAERGLWEETGHEAFVASEAAAVCVERGGRMIGLLTLRDAVRPDSPATVAALRSLVGEAVMLTGDNARTAARVAAETGVSSFRADLLPEDKVAAVREMQTRGPVAMVGDGVNDAPALATASVGIAMGAAGSDAAIEAADVALMGDTLARLPFAIRLSRRTHAIIRQNVAFSLATKAVFLALTLAGGANLWVAVLADMGTSLLVTANALRVLRDE